MVILTDSSQFISFSTSRLAIVRNIRGHDYKLYKTYAIDANPRINFFANRTVNNLNSLPGQICNAGQSFY